MVDYEKSSQLQCWLYESSEQLDHLRNRANLQARKYLAEEEAVVPATDHQHQQEQRQPTSTSSSESSSSKKPPVYSFARGYQKNNNENSVRVELDTTDLSTNPSGHPYITTQEEKTLVSFYVSKIPNLIGPNATLSRLRGRDSKVVATAATFVRRFYLSNSVMLYDPKTIMVAAIFLACKVEDCTVDIRYLEEGTAQMNAPVSQQEILLGEIALVQGIQFDLFCFHPYKGVLALIEDLRAYLKSEQGKQLVHRKNEDQSSAISGQDLKPLYESARKIVDQAVLSETIPLLYNPGQVAFAALMVAQKELESIASLHIDLEGYLEHRFRGEREDLAKQKERLRIVSHALEKMREESKKEEDELQTLKAIHKRLKKVRAWGSREKTKKRKGGNEEAREPSKKKIKT